MRIQHQQRRPGSRSRRAVLGFALGLVASAWLCAGASAQQAASPAASTPASLAIVLKVSNEVSQRPDDNADWKPATKGEILGAGHQIRTGSDGFCAIMFRDDRSLLKVNASTE